MSKKTYYWARFFAIQFIKAMAELEKDPALVDLVNKSGNGGSRALMKQHLKKKV